MARIQLTIVQKLLYLKLTKKNNSNNYKKKGKASDST